MAPSRRTISRASALAALGLVAAACGPAAVRPAAAPPAAPEVPPVVAAPPSWRVDPSAFPDLPAPLCAEYQRRASELLYFDQGALNPDGVAAVQLLTEAWSHGLPRPAGWTSRYAAAVEVLDATKAAGADHQAVLAAAVRADAELFAALRRFEAALRARAYRIDPDDPPVRLPAATLPRHLVPSHPEYEALRAAYVRYVDLARAGRLDPLQQLPGWTVRPNRSHASLPAVRARLELEGFGASEALEPERLDPELRARLKRYQLARGLDPSGRLDGPTQRALSAPPEDILRRLELGLARWHGSAARFAGDHLLINIPAYEVELIEGGAVAARYDAVVGKTYWRTPIMQTDMGWVFVRPTWFGSRDRDSPVKPGPDNPLGDLTIRSTDMSELIYLHGTNRPDLFRYPYRTYSRGCIRLSDPVPLAARLLDRDPGPETGELLRELVDRKRSRRLPLAEPVRAFFIYNTTWASADRSHLVLARDVYALDPPARRALADDRVAAATWGRLEPTVDGLAASAHNAAATSTPE